jgi:hypothetical protein
MPIRNDLIYGPIIGNLHSKIVHSVGFSAIREQLPLHDHTDIIGHDGIRDVSEEVIQISVHCPGRGMKRELALVFPEKKNEMDDLKVIPIFLKSRVNLVAVTPESNVERDEKLEMVISFYFSTDCGNEVR